MTAEDRRVPKSMALIIKSALRGPDSPFEPPSLLFQLLFFPIKTLILYIYSFLLVLRGPSFHPHPLTSRIRLVAISDTHTHKPASIPPGDVLIHAGDLTNQGTVAEIQEQVDWLASLPHPNKVVIAGNHDSFFDPRSRRKEDVRESIHWGKIRYLQHSSVVLEFPQQENRRLKFYGAPQIPRCGDDDFAFQYQRSEDAWSGTIPKETDVLITHTPPRHHLDLPAGLGCDFLRKEIWRVRPKVHIFGHVHAGYGREYVSWDKEQTVLERLCGRDGSGYLRDLLSIHVWMDIVKLLWYGVRGVLWNRVWGGDEGGGVMINASLMYRSTGQLRNRPQIIDI